MLAIEKIILFALLEEILEVVEDKQLYLYPRYFLRMNRYNSAPWYIDYLPAQFAREFRNRNYYPRHYRANYRRFQQAHELLVLNYQEKTHYLMKLFDQLEENHQQAMPLFFGDRSKKVDFLKTECFLVMAKFRHYGKNY